MGPWVFFKARNPRKCTWETLENSSKFFQNSLDFFRYPRVSSKTCNPQHTWDRSPCHAILSTHRPSGPSIGFDFGFGLDSGWQETQGLLTKTATFLMVILLMEEIRLTSWRGQYPIICRITYMSGGAGFLPSTVWLVILSCLVLELCHEHLNWCGILAIKQLPWQVCSLDLQRWTQCKILFQQRLGK